MFNRGVQKTDGDILSKLRVTSKLAVKLSCISIYPNDIIKAEQLYEFIVKDMPNLPDTDPVPPTGFEKVKTGVGDMVGFIRNNKERSTLEKLLRTLSRRTANRVSWLLQRKFRKLYPSGKITRS